MPHADVGPEAECGALAGPDVSIHAARLDFAAMRAGGEMDPTILHDAVEAFVHAAWFDADLDAAGARYFGEAGFDVVQHAPCGLPSGQTRVTPQALYDWIADRIAETRAETLFVGGNGQRAIGIIDAVERSFGLRMLTANQVLYWAALRAVGGAFKKGTT